MILASQVDIFIRLIFKETCHQNRLNLWTVGTEPFRIYKKIPCPGYHQEGRNHF
jgi:hypothetical protein